MEKKVVGNSLIYSGNTEKVSSSHEMLAPSVSVHTEKRGGNKMYSVSTLCQTLCSVLLACSIYSSSETLKFTLLLFFYK